MVDRRTTRHLVRGDQPLVSAREEVIGKFLSMDPPRIAIGPQAHKAAVDVAMVGEGLGVGHEVGPIS